MMRLFAVFLVALSAFLHATQARAACSARDSLPRLHADEVNCIVQQAVEVTSRQGISAMTVAVTDRVGNVLGLYQLGATPSRVRIRSGLLSTVRGLDNVVLNDLPIVGDTAPARAAIAKAITAAYFSSAGNAFSTRTAGFIVQRHFPPLFPNTPSGPLFGVQFSQLACGDFVQKGSAIGPGSRASPLGAAADPGGFPLYKSGQMVGAIGVVAGTNSIYGIDLDTNPAQLDQDLEEIIAQSATAGFRPRPAIRADRITAGGITLRYTDSDARLLMPATVLGAVPTAGTWVPLANYFPGTGARTGMQYGLAESGFEPASGLLQGYFNLPRRPPRESLFPSTATQGALGLTQREVEILLKRTLDVASITRSQIRRPLGEYAQVTATIVDASGNVLGQARTPDALIDSSDVTIQKARTAVFFSRPTAADRLTLAGGGSYVTSAQTFFGRSDALRNGRAFSTRAIGSIHRPNFPDGIDGKPRGPLSRGADWSPFNVGLELDLVLRNLQILRETSSTCTLDSSNVAINIGLANGMTIFPGGFPIYREMNGSLYIIGAISASGDGSDQSDLIAFVGLQRATETLAATPPPTLMTAYRPPRHPPSTVRVSGLKYVQCPQSPFLNSTAQDPCAGF
jgi:uncharacterized protein GlcG (DUF336 family)